MPKIKTASATVALALLIALTACTSNEQVAPPEPPAPSKSIAKIIPGEVVPERIYGLATQDGVCPTPKLARKYGWSGPLRLLTPLHMPVRPFSGTAEIMPSDSRDRKLVEVKTSELRPCFERDRVQCAKYDGVALAEGFKTSWPITSGDKLVVNAPFKYAEVSLTWVTIDGVAAEFVGALEPCST